MEVNKICQFCGNRFVAKKTTTKCCSDYAEILKALIPQYIYEYTGLIPKIEEEKWKKHDFQIDYKKRLELHPEWYTYSGF
ncbi:hypothetical protein JOE44_004908 [Chryseobacterium sp. PvR013]|uniref:hypothetical protein n=1 Tax=Chryseobacterium sp. PvR013 TaxID=2806595 RepID=UPI001AEB8EE2|nr:hypothetical protein [Chryseobacterium sp. PvR013]MBP1168024.1 hypothetical protein [Chryseobacterium sp. PvR013]